MFSPKKLAGLLMVVSLFGFALAPAAQATSLTSGQISSILQMLQAFGADQSVINNVSSALGGSSSAVNQSCVDLPSNLTLGSSGSDVTNLQNYLAQKGYFTATATGYYGMVTAQAVGQLQLSLGIVSSANDTAYGIMGPRTRAQVGCGGTPVVNNSGFSATPTSGPAPLTVRFSQIATDDWRAIIDYGDGTSCAVGGTANPDCQNTFVHTYTAPGTYTAKLSSSTGTDGASRPPLGTATITVTGGQTSATPTATLDSGPLTVNTAKDTAPVTLTGSASNTGSVVVFISGYHYGSVDYNTMLGQLGKDGIYSLNSLVSSGRWTSPFTQGLTGGTYQVLVYNAEAGHALLTTGTLTINANSIANAPTATIDQSSLTTTSGGPTITGTASGVSSVYVAVTAGTNQAGTANQTGSGQVSVVNGHWNVTIYPKADVFTAGVYSVSVYTTMGGTLLTTDTLSILGNALQPTATIDQSSLSGPYGNVTLTGTATNIPSSSVLIKIAAPSGPFANTAIATPVTNGRWSRPVVLPSPVGCSIYAASNGGCPAYPVQQLAPGSYPVTVYSDDANGTNGPVLASGTLTINPTQ